MQYQFRPLNGWPFPNTRDRRTRWTFKASWQATLNLVERELGYLNAKDIVIQADFREGDIRMDGMPRSNARVPEHPGVIISFNSKHGPLQYASDSCDFWQHNVRSIGLGLQSLRAVDRYGITRTGEQYRGWKQLGSGIEMGAGSPFSTAEEAALWIHEHDDDGMEPHDLDLCVHYQMTSESYRREIYRSAAKLLHPDAGGNPEDFKRLSDAIALIKQVTQ